MDLNLSPIPTEMATHDADLGEVKAVMLMVTTPAGINGFFLTDDMAIQIGNQLVTRGKQARNENSLKSRLTVVEKPGIVVPGGHDAQPQEGTDTNG